MKQPSQGPGLTRLSVGLLFTLVFCMSFSSVLWARQRYQEQRLTQQLKDSVTQGEALMLKIAPDDEFLALYMEATTPRSRGGVILLHDIGAHPDWPELIAPLRTQLPRYGWHTLSLQMPLLSDHPTPQEYVELFSEARARIAAGVDYFSSRGIYNMVVVGHSLGGAMGLTWLASEAGKQSRAIAFVGIGVYDHEHMDTSITSDKSIAQLTIPVLDIVGNLDRRVVLDSANARATQAKKAGRKNYQLVTIPGADHFFTGLENSLVKRIRVWLNKQAPSMEIEAGSLDPKKAQ